MARFFECQILLNFDLDDYSELTSMRNTIESYINGRADGSTFQISYLENDGNSIVHFAKVTMKITATSRADVNTIFTQIENNLASLPDTVKTNGKEFEFWFREYEA